MVTVKDIFLGARVELTCQLEQMFERDEFEEDIDHFLMMYDEMVKGLRMTKKQFEREAGMAEITCVQRYVKAVILKVRSSLAMADDLKAAEGWACKDMGLSDRVPRRPGS